MTGPADLPVLGERLEGNPTQSDSLRSSPQPVGPATLLSGYRAAANLVAQARCTAAVVVLAGQKSCVREHLLSNKVMTLQQLRDFLAIVEHGSLRGAARAREVSQAGLTRSLQKLEAELGLSLLVRTSQGVSLTAYGEHLLSYAQQILASCERVTEDLRQMQGLEGGTLRLGISPSPSIELLPFVLPEFRRLYPGVMIELVHGLGQLLLTALREQRIELAVTPLSQRADAADLASTPLYPTDPCLICRSGHPLAQATSVVQLREA